MKTLTKKKVASKGTQKKPTSPTPKPKSKYKSAKPGQRSGQRK